jgi:hypothetical protein|tara:strand:+ start:1032 stop:1229 length:198 start_codon:yes stop_codon:yes gene_type:complete
MEQWLEPLLGYGPLGIWLVWQLIRDRAQSKTISELTEALSENANSQQTIAQAITDIRTYLMGQGR